MGDVKLAAVMGIFLGRAVGPAMFAALLAGSVVGIGIMARTGPAGASARSRSARGSPSAASSGCSSATQIVDWYLGTFT